METPEIVIVPVVFMIMGVVATIRMWLIHKEKMAARISPTATNPVLEERLARIEQAVDAIAVEMERVGEGQRFVTQLLSDRPPESRTPALPGDRTKTP